MMSKIQKLSAIHNDKNKGILECKVVYDYKNTKNKIQITNDKIEMSNYNDSINFETSSTLIKGPLAASKTIFTNSGL